MEIFINCADDVITESFKLECPTNNTVLNKIAKTFSVANPAAFFIKQYGYNVPSKIYGVNQFGYFQYGLFFDVLTYLKLNYPHAKIILNDDVKNIISNRLPLREFAKTKYTGVENISESLKLRDYQKSAINSIITQGYGRAMFENPTGSGKSLVLANIIYTLQKQYKSNIRTLLFLPNAQLVSQFTKDLIEYGFPKTNIIAYTPKTQKKLTSEEILNCPIIISNRQFLFNHIQELGEFDMLLFDEAHSMAPDSKTEKLVNAMKCPIKIACSGTIPKAKHKYWRLLHAFGPVVSTEEITTLQDSGYLTQVKFTLIKAKDMVVERDRNFLFHIRPNIKYSDETEIAFNAAFNAETEYMSENCMNLYSPVFKYINIAVGNTLILFDRLEFGKALFAFLQKIKYNNAKIFYIDGSVDVDVREQIRKTCEEQDNVIIVAQVSIMSTGINIKNLTNLIMTGSNKSHSRTIQSIGRLLRVHSKKEYANIYDIVFHNFKYSRRHYNERRALYKEHYKKDKPDKIIDVIIN